MNMCVENAADQLGPIYRGLLMNVAMYSVAVSC